MPDDLSAPEANRLYWDSDLSVAAITERLEVSRRALYDVIEPYPTGQACAVCGAALGFPNRTARERAAAVCAACGSQAPLKPEPDQAVPDGPTGDRTRKRVERPAAAAPVDQRGAVLLTAAVGGVVAGALGGLLLRRLR